ncbi:MAG: trehalose-phosphatase [Gammaproteobacteria bacterium]
MNSSRNASRARSVILDPTLPPALCLQASALFLDVDGTLLPLSAHPREVEVPASLLETLNALRDLSGGALALVSGRPQATLDQLFAPECFALAGQHGTERRDAVGNLHIDRRHAETLARLRPLAGELAAGIPGAFVEDKGLSIAIHAQHAQGALARLRHLLEEALATETGLSLLEGKAVLEIRSVQADKGRALRAFMAEPPFRGRLPVYLGDDVTDESAFEAVNLEGGLSIKVGPGPSVARFRLASPDAAVSWLTGHVRLEERP